MSLSWRALLTVIIVQTLWGANPVALKFGLIAVPPLWSAFIRFCIGAACVIVWARITGRTLWPPADEWRGHGIMSLMFAVQVAVMNIGFDHTSASMGSVLMATHPLWATLFARWLITSERLGWQRAVGLLLAFLGAALILTRGVALDASGATVVGSWIVLSSASMLGFRLAFAARLLRRMDSLRITLWQMVLSLPLFAAGGFMFETVHWDRLDWPSSLGLLYQGVVIAGFGFAVNYALLQRYSPSLILGFGFIAPVSGVLLSAWLLGDSLTWAVAVGAAAVGVGLVMSARAK